LGLSLRLPQQGKRRHHQRLQLISGEAITIDNDALYVSNSSTETGRVVTSLRDVACWLEAIEEDDASPLAAA
jgi:hypothetical protein